MAELSRADIIKALRIRIFEERLLELFSEGKLNGTVHTCVGQEFSAVSVLRNFQSGDWISSNHRGHGHFLAISDDVRGLMAEIMGKRTGICGGIGGSQHLFANGFLSNGIQGGMPPVSTGMALALKRQTGKNVVFNFFGDGTLGEGSLYEALNISSQWKLPVVWVLENNGYAQSTDTKTTISGSVRGRAEAFGIPYFKGDIWNTESLFAKAHEAVALARTTQAPVFIEIQSYRLKPHSKGDDNRAREEVMDFEVRDPLGRLLSKNADLQEILNSEIKAQIADAVAFGDASEVCAYTPTASSVRFHREECAATLKSERCSSQIYEGLKAAFTTDSSLMLIGEDIEGPYGGAFKVTKDLSQLFEGRVRNTPIAESAIVGIATGAALMGHKCMGEIMFGDFMTLTLDQLYQHAGKFRQMYNGQVKVPILVRTPMGGRRGYGPTHSQSIEKHFLGIPGVTVVAINHRLDLTEFYKHLLESLESPHVVIENKIVYTRSGNLPVPTGYAIRVSHGTYPTVRIASQGTPDVTLFCYGGILEEVEKALNQLFAKHEILVEVICPTLLSELDIEPLAESVARTKRLIAIEEGNSYAGLSTQAVAQLNAHGLQFISRVVGYEGIIPASLPLEMQLLWGTEKIVKEVTKVVHGHY